ncbi:MAG: hypothetical protein WAO23_01205 [Dethiobacteria bacterium]
MQITKHPPYRNFCPVFLQAGSCLELNKSFFVSLSIGSRGAGEDTG